MALTITLENSSPRDSNMNWNNSRTRRQSRAAIAKWNESIDCKLVALLVHLLKSILALIMCHLASVRDRVSLVSDTTAF